MSGAEGALIIGEAMAAKARQQQSGMVERVARVIWDARISVGGGPPLCPEAAWCRKTARSVIAAMREPTDAMVKAAEATETDYAIGEGHASCKEHWRAMIDGALKESTP